jgi:hypothetical protein
MIMPTVTGDPSDVLLAVARQLKSAGEKELRKEFLKGLRDLAKPILPAVRRSAEARFPTKGGLNRHMARGTRYRTVVKTGATTAGVSIRANKTDPRVDTRGRVSHPIPGPDGQPLRDEKGRRIMAVQYFPEAVGFFRDPIEAQAVAVRDALVQQLERWALEHMTP